MKKFEFAVKQKVSKMEQEWFANEQWWFNCHPDIDIYLTKKYSYTLDNEYHDSPLNMILALDQLPHHIFRDEMNSHIITYFLQKAINISLSLTQEYLDSLPDEKWCFAMLPMRHSKEYKYILDVMAAAWKRLAKTPNSITIRRFLKATYQRCPTEDQISRLHVQPPHGIHFNMSEHEGLLDHHKEDVTTLSELKDAERSVDPCILSLSGGVDSMVCSVLNASNIVAAVHINYSNRDTADQEENFVRAWCANKCIPLYVRKITEIKRKECMDNELRDTYETYTRNARYGTYKTVAKMLGMPVARVMLGHNKDDCLENIFTNIAHRNHMENLKGMTVLSEQDGIVFYRPLLNCTKKEIKGYATFQGIPHLPNSTPVWSQRGKIRAELVPVIDAWDPRFVSGLMEVSSMMSSMYSLLDKVTEDIALSLKERGCTQVAELFTQHEYWREVIVKACGISPSNRSLNNLRDRLEVFQKTNQDSCNIVIHKRVSISFARSSSKIDIKLSLS